jgi:hypothetical protein
MFVFEKGFYAGHFGLHNYLRIAILGSSTNAKKAKKAKKANDKNRKQVLTLL